MKHTLKYDKEEIITAEAKEQTKGEPKEEQGEPLKPRTTAEAIKDLHTPRPLKNSLWSWFFTLILLMCAFSFYQYLAVVPYLISAALLLPPLKKFWLEHKLTDPVRYILAAVLAVAATLLVPKELFL